MHGSVQDVVSEPEQAVLVLLLEAKRGARVWLPLSSLAIVIQTELKGLCVFSSIQFIYLFDLFSCHSDSDRAARRSSVPFTAGPKTWPGTSGRACIVAIYASNRGVCRP